MTDAETLTVGLELPSAQLLADQITTIKDLQFVMECCKRLLTELVKPEEEQDGVVPQALWSAALTAYDRCFAKGKKFGLTTDDVKSLPLVGPGQVEPFPLADRAARVLHGQRLPEHLAEQRDIGPAGLFGQLTQGAGPEVLALVEPAARGGPVAAIGRPIVVAHQQHAVVRIEQDDAGREPFRQHPPIVPCPFSVPN